MLVAAVQLIVGAAVDRSAGQRRLSPVTDAMLRDPAPADWLMWRRTLDSWGYSPLDQIDRSNVRATLRRLG
jgi:alcohol dehydrogenase (cytochrome c)